MKIDIDRHNLKFFVEQLIVKVRFVISRICHDSELDLKVKSFWQAVNGMELNFFDFKVRGIDISHYDLSLLVEKLVGKVHFVICRIGHGTRLDLKFKSFWSALKGKVFRLTYFYLDYYSNHLPDEKVFGIEDYEWGVIQGKNAWNNLKNDNDYPIVYLDIENGNQSYAPEIHSVWNRVELMADGFFDTYDKLSGITNGIYCSLSKLRLFSPKFRKRPLYIAWYNEDQTRESVIKAVRDRGWEGPIHFWQYSSDGDAGTDGQGDGIDFGLGRPAMDLDVWMGTEEEWDTFKKGGIMSDYLLKINPIGQEDPKWNNIKLGTSVSTIGQQGCLITCMSMFLKFVGFDTDPQRLNTLLLNNGGYYDGNLFVWGSVTKFYPGLTFGYRYNYAALDKIDEQLARGLPAVVEVDYNPATAPIDQHWVLVVGKVGGSYIINDPKKLGDQIKFEDRYGDPKSHLYIVNTYNYDGNTVTPLFEVKVLISNLLIRKGPAKTYGVYGVYAKGIYDVYEEKDGYYKIGPDRWISADPIYTQKLGDLAEPTDIEKLGILWSWYKETHPS